MLFIDGRRGIRNHGSIFYSIIILAVLTIETQECTEEDGSDILYYTKDSNSNPTNFTLCETKICQEEGRKFESNLNKSVDPCDDFYEFACGGWIKNHPILENYVRMSQVTSQMHLIRDRLRDILSSSSNENEMRSLRYAKRIFQLCMDQETREREGLSPLEVLTDGFGGWPIVLEPNSWNVNNEVKWQDVNRAIQRSFRGSLFRMQSQTYPVMPKIHARYIYLRPPYYPFKMNVMQNPEKYEAEFGKLRDLIRDVVFIWTADKRWGKSSEFREAVEQDANNIVNFVVELAAVEQAIEGLPDQATLMPIERLQEIYDTNNNYSMDDKTHINWVDTVKNTFSSVNVSINSTTQIQVHSVKFIKNLSNLLHRTPMRTIVNYMIWSTINPLLQYTNNQTRNLVKQTDAKLTTSDAICIEGPNLKVAHDNEYLKIYFPNSSRLIVRAHVDRILEAITQEATRFSWADDESRSVILNKLSRMRAFIGGPDWYYDDEAVEDYYRNFNLGSTYIENAANIRIFERMLDLKLMEVDFYNETGDQWHTTPLKVAATYYRSDNQLTITAGVLEPHLFRRDRPAVINHALLGWTIAHEIMHGVVYDYKIRDFAEASRIGLTSKWTDETYRAFKNITKCLVRQFNAYMLPETADWEEPLYNDGKKTLSENVADSAIYVAHKDYKTQKQISNEPEIRLPGLQEYSEAQLFFITAASSFCENFRPEIAQDLIENSHATGHARILGTFSNFKEFVKAFNCSKTSPMYRKRECNIWR